MRMIAVLLCGALAACSQTGTSQTTGTQVTKRTTAQATARKAPSQDRCQEAVAKAQQQATNSAMLGGALSMVGGLGGFAGRGGAIAAQAASIGGSMIGAKARDDTQAAIQSECM